jgi:NAD+ kinase
MMLEGVIQNTDGTRITDVALNDIVVGRSGALRLTDYRIYVNDEFLAVYSADGIIIATPTGSTAYSLSAGGPIISPEAELIAVTPICSHTLNARSIILSAKDTVTIELCKDRDGVSRERLVSYDGDNSRNVETGGVITIRQAKQRTTILRLDKISFLEVLRNKFS